MPGVPTGMPSKYIGILVMSRKSTGEPEITSGMPRKCNRMPGKFNGMPGKYIGMRGKYTEMPGKYTGMILSPLECWRYLQECQGNIPENQIP